ncbi:FCD domain-containing protein [Streptomyces sp. RLB1-33]|uniref:FadR/GntR family transcriptional regulator n=1 Tax=Streptomyces mirabilis TaxID=68239 RepID=UPI00143E62D9|nr:MULTISPECIES: FCD domain-containing protein [Streptomyces]QIY71634.1 FadR family transcriptional regulator [Streptomyces sp. RLB1-33]QUW81391.1 FadR family transcriptional regulator [Streptomyces mirabilis]
MVNAAGKFGPYDQPGQARPAPVAGMRNAPLLSGRGQTGSELVRSRIALQVRLKSVSPGDRLPDAGVLAEELGISEITVRRALEGMCQDGLLDRRRGRAGGTFVAPGWDTVVALMHDADEAASLNAFHLLLECGLVAHSAGELPVDRLEGLRTLVDEMDLADDPARLLELEARFHLDLAEALGGPGIREFAGDLLGRLCLLLPAPTPAVVRAQNRCHAELLAELGRGAMDPAVRAVKQHQHVRPS